VSFPLTLGQGSDSPTPPVAPDPPVDSLPVALEALEADSFGEATEPKKEEVEELRGGREGKVEEVELEREERGGAVGRFGRERGVVAVGIGGAGIVE